MGIFKGIAQRFAKANGQMTQFRLGNRKKRLDRDEQRIKSKADGKFVWFHSSFGRVRANTKSEARAKFRVLGATGRFGIVRIEK